MHQTPERKHGVPGILELLVPMTGVFAFLSAIFGWQIVPLRIAAGYLFIAYGVMSFPWPKEDRHKIGLAVGCVVFAISGALANALGSWWPLAGGVALGYTSVLLLTPMSRGALFRAILPTKGRAVVTDNFEYIALNMALIRRDLEVDWGERFPDEKTLFVGCGVLDTLMHIQEGHFTVQDVVDAMLPARLGKCRLGLTTIPAENEMQAALFGPSDLFLSYTLQIECMIFNAIERHVDSSGMDERDIIVTAIDQKERIGKMLDTSAEELDANALMCGVRALAAEFMEEPEFSDYRKVVGIDD